jgi:hypothetical protein
MSFAKLAILGGFTIAGVLIERFNKRRDPRRLTVRDEIRCAKVVESFEISKYSADEPANFGDMWGAFDNVDEISAAHRWKITAQVVDTCRLKLGFLPDTPANRLVVEREARKTCDSLGAKGLRRTVALRILPLVPVLYFVRTSEQILGDKMRASGAYVENQTTDTWVGVPGHSQEQPRDVA